MKLPQPELHTYFDEQLGERVYYACEPMAFDNGGTNDGTNSGSTYDNTDAPNL